MNEVKKNEKGNTKASAISIIFFIIVIALTVGLKVYSNSIAASHQENSNKIEELSNRINEIKMDKKVQIYSLLEKNKTLLERKKVLSDIPSFVGEMHKIAADYKLTLSGFDYTNGIISSLAEAETDDNELAYKKTSTFIREYRKPNENLFNVLFVDSLTGTNDIKFNVNLEVK